MKPVEPYFGFRLNSIKFYRIQFKPTVSTGALTRKISLGTFLEESIISPTDVITPVLTLKTFRTACGSWEISVQNMGNDCECKDATRRLRKRKVICSGLRPTCIEQTYQSNTMLAGYIMSSELHCHSSLTSG